MSVNMHHQTVTVEGRTFELGHGDLVLIRGRRDHIRSIQRGGNAPGGARAVRHLREELAERLGTDYRTAARLLRQVKTD